MFKVTFSHRDEERTMTVAAVPRIGETVEVKGWLVDGEQTIFQVKGVNHFYGAEKLLAAEQAVARIFVELVALS